MGLEAWGLGFRTCGLGLALALGATPALAQHESLRRLGSSQVFQTGETLDNSPLIDYQHPHDLIMGASAAPNPTVPLSHHQLDSTHITHGVVTVGVVRSEWTGEVSAFRGREPDENRRDLDFGALDSWSTRIGWRRGGLSVQVSGGRLRQPDAIELGDVTRLTASVAYEGLVRGRATAVTLAWGENRGSVGIEDAYLAELVIGLGSRGSLYSRAEVVDKHILSAGGRHPPGLQHPHILSRVGALTGGYVHRVADTPGGQIAVGGDVTGYRVPSNLAEAYGRPVSIHLFVQWRR